jgi:hypothetical protein
MLDSPPQFLQVADFVEGVYRGSGFAPLATRVQQDYASVGNPRKLKRSRKMAIEKKSLISNRTATKKAIVTKPEVSKVAPTRLNSFKVGGAARFNITSSPRNRVSFKTKA